MLSVRKIRKRVSQCWDSNIKSSENQGEVRKEIAGEGEGKPRGCSPESQAKEEFSEEKSDQLCATLLTCQTKGALRVQTEFSSMETIGNFANTP